MAEIVIPTKTIIATDKAPAAIGPYSQAVKTGKLLFVSGIMGLNPATGHLVPGGIKAETEQTLKNLQAILTAAGATPKNVVKATVYLLDMADFATVNEIYAKTFGEEPPARACVAVIGLAKGARVEIEAIATL